MKKALIYALFLLNLSFTASFGQLQRTFWGIELGKTTKVQAQEILKAQGRDVISGENGNIFVYTNIKFGGVEWTWVCFEFFHDKLTKVNFQLDGDYNTLLSTYNNLHTIMMKKYSIYYKDYVDKPYDDWFSDDDTGILLNIYKWKGSEHCLSLMYGDKNLASVEEKVAESEL